MKPKPFVKVVWDDATSDTDTFTLAKLKYESCLTTTVGILVKKERDGLVLATDYVPSLKEYRGKHTIPRGMIKEIVVLCEPALSEQSK